MVHASSLRIGKSFCPGYTLKRLRGRGGFGSVWEATTDDKREVALKFLECTDGVSAAQEIKAIQFVSQLRHVNLTRIDKVWCHAGYVVVSMALADGSLADLYETCQSEFKTPMKPEEVCPLLDQAAAGLDFLNTRQHVLDGVRVAIQHCDVKPSNILLFGDTVKLCDYGLSSLTTSMLKPHGRAGTLEYAAPEIFQGRLSDHSDQYALAVSYCQLRGGRLPFPDVPKDFNFNYVRPAPDLDMLSPPERPIIARALSSAPPDRWPTCRELIAQLRKALPKLPRR